MSDLADSLYCFNPITGKRDGKYCVWEGKGKCLKCQAAERIQQLEEENTRLGKAWSVMHKRCFEYEVTLGLRKQDHQRSDV